MLGLQTIPYDYGPFFISFIGASLLKGLYMLAILVPELNS